MPTHQQPLHIAVDGSSNGLGPARRIGYAVVFLPDPLADTGPGQVTYQHGGHAGTSLDAELLAIEQALIEAPSDRHLFIHTDCHEALFRIQGRQVRKSGKPSTNEAHLDRLKDLIASRYLDGSRVELRAVHQDTAEHPEHAVAHFLAFVGRISTDPGRVGDLADPATVEQRVRQILAADSPNRVAHDLVRLHLFPDSTR